MITLESWKRSNDIGELAFNLNKESGRYVSNALVNGVDSIIVTTVPFNPKAPVYVRPMLGADPDTGEAKEYFVLTNKDGNPDFTL